MEEIKHTVQLRERKILELTGILSVVSFRDRETEFESNMGHLQITGGKHRSLPRCHLSSNYS